MKNKEKYAKEIVEISIKGNPFGFHKYLNEVKSCNSLQCKECLFNGQRLCKDTRCEWANSEYKEKKEFSEADKLYVRVMDKFNWFARDRDGVVYGYVDKPFKNGSMWDVKAGVDEGYELERVSNYTSATFESLSWEDKEPTHRSEILGER